jgi:hypothetical protein
LRNKAMTKRARNAQGSRPVFIKERESEIRKLHRIGCQVLERTQKEGSSRAESAGTVAAEPAVKFDAALKAAMFAERFKEET